MTIRAALGPVAIIFCLLGCGREAADQRTTADTTVEAEGTEAAADRSMREAEAAIDAQADAMATNASSRFAGNESEATVGQNGE